MTTKLTHIGHASRLRHQRGDRRRGTILVLVMAVLGLLFVSGVAFMATMNFESSIISSERRLSQSAPAMDQVMADTSNLIAELVEPPEGLATGNSLAKGAATYVQLPGVHNLAAPIDPYLDPNDGRMYWPWVTDLQAIQAQSFEGSNFKMGQQDDPIDVGQERMFRLDARQKPGYEVLAGQTGDADVDGSGFADAPGEFVKNFRTLVDADGDGIVDAVEVDLAMAAGGNKRRLAGLARILNPASKPSGTVKLGLRVVSHSGMVNVNASHPLLISNVLDSIDNLNPPYSPTVEEPSLRRRNFLPPERLPFTQLQGSRFSSDPITGDGQFTGALFPDKETPREHRYWPFGPDEMGADPEFPLWWLRMDADGAEPDPADPNDEYDRRHLVTTISYSDLLRRPSLVGQAGVNKDLIDLVIEKFPDDAVSRFPLIAYPFTDAAEVTVTKNCISNPDCTLGPRKGRLKLSLAWLDKAFSTGLITRTERTQLIQDAFTLLLINARGSEWGSYQPDPTDTTGHRTYWMPDYNAISRTAASLTANMIDFSDMDDTPTAVTLRIADPANPNFGKPSSSPPLPPEEVFGLEAQPFITEVAALADPQDDLEPNGELDALEVSTGSTSFFGIELFNPFNDPIELNDYSLVTGSSTMRFPPDMKLAPLEIRAFHSGVKPSIVTNSTPFDMGTLFFKEGDSIKLVRLTVVASRPVDVIVDRFLTGDGVGALDANLLTLQRVASGNIIERWYAPVPLDSSSMTSTGNVTLGEPNSGLPEGPPVELIFPNAPDGTFSKVFPTTGMLLMLMRHANSTSKAFTEELNNNLNELDTSDSTPTDNGRMPIYDESKATTTGYHAHHIDPNWDMTKMSIPAVGSGGLPTVGVQGTTGKAGGAMHLPWGQFVFDYFTALPLDGPGPFTHDGSGRLIINEDAPPKVDMGGLRVHGQIDLNTAPWKVLEGLPFMTMDLIPTPFNTTFTTAVQKLKNTDSTLPVPIGNKLAKAMVAYRELRALTVRPSGTTGDYSTADTAVSRGWSDTSPAMRRGTGFMTIGELANVRNTAALSAFRTDSGVLSNPNDVNSRSYVESIAVLASLGDWLTLRPDVFTVYGTLRGEKDRTITDPADPDIQDLQVRDVSSRALRFQETVDRLPAILGEPVRMIGPQVIGKYYDTRGD